MEALSGPPRSNRRVLLVAAATFVNGALGVAHSVFTRVPERPHMDAFLPFGLHAWSRLLTLLTGFWLLHLSYQLLRRRRTAWWVAVAASTVATLAHAGRGHHAVLAIAPASTLALLLTTRSRFTVRTEPRSLANGAVLVAATLATALAYGTLGFWLLDRRDFGIDFHADEAVLRTLREYAMLGNLDLHPHTRHARWFLDSLDLMGLAAVVAAGFSLYRPLAFRLRTLPRERAHASALVAAHGASAIDYFKLWHDKSYFFGAGGRSVVAFRAAWSHAVALGDPVGPPQTIRDTVREFSRFATDQGWRVAFHYILPDHLALYRAEGFRVLKIGEEALVDLERFAATTGTTGDFRRARNRAGRAGLTVTHHMPPHPPALIDEMQDVSNEWLTLPGRRERSFTLGGFERGYLGSTRLAVAREAGGRALAFTNVIPCWPPGDATIDLMRHRVEVPNGTMDLLFLELLLALRATHRRFSLGLAPLAGVGDRPGASLEERAVHQLYEHVNRFFSYKGLRSYKSKFEPLWEDRFLACSGPPTTLLQVGLALARLTEERLDA